MEYKYFRSSAQLFCKQEHKNVSDLTAFSFFEHLVWEFRALNARYLSQDVFSFYLNDLNAELLEYLFKYEEVLFVEHLIKKRHIYVPRDLLIDKRECVLPGLIASFVARNFNKIVYCGCEIHDFEEICNVSLHHFIEAQRANRTMKYAKRFL